MKLFRREITFEKALKIAKRCYRKYNVVSAWDLETAWLFGYDFELYIEASNVLVSKKDGSVTFYHNPLEYKGTKPSAENMIFFNRELLFNRLSNKRHSI